MSTTSKITVLRYDNDYADWKDLFTGLLRRKELTWVLEVDKWNKSSTASRRNTRSRTKKVKGRTKDGAEIEIELDDDEDDIDPAITTTREYFVKAEQLKGYIQETVSKSIWNSIKKLDSPKDMLDHLDKLFQQSPEIRAEKAYTELNNLRFRFGNSIKEHLSNFEKLVNDVEEVEGKMADARKKSLFWSTLGNHFSNAKEHILSREELDGKRLSFEEIKKYLSKYEDRISNKCTETRPPKTDPRNGQPNSSTSRHTNYGCYRCGRSNHIAKNCKLPPNVKCENCGKAGHTQDACRILKSNRNPSSSINNTEVETRHSQDDDDEPDAKVIMLTEGAVSANSIGNESLVNYEDLFIDSGATNKFFNNRQWFTRLEHYDGEVTSSDADSSPMKIVGIGDADIQVTVDGKSRTVRFKDIYYVPTCRKNLISMGELDHMGFKFTVGNDLMEIWDNSNSRVLLQAKRSKNNLYKVKLQPSLPEVHNANKINLRVSDTPQQLWHQRLGHVNHEYLRRMISEKSVDGLDNVQIKTKEFCEACVLGKQARRPFPTGRQKATDHLQRVHIDIMGKMPAASLDGNWYYLVIADEATHSVYGVGLKRKSDAFKEFQTWKVRIEVQSGKKLKTLISDEGTEFDSNQWKKLCNEDGIQRLFTAPYTPQQNGVVERWNRVIVESARSMMENAKLGPEFWEYAVDTAIYLRNRTVFKDSNATPYELVNQCKPNISHLRIFGCDAYCKVLPAPTKFEPRSRKTIFVGYSLNHKAYRCYDATERKLLISRDVQFNEWSFGNRQEIQENERFEWERNQTDSDYAEESSDDEYVSNQVTSAGMNDRRITRSATRQEANIMEYPPEPTHIKQALADPEEGEHWLNAITAEIGALETNGTWEVVNLADLPPGTNIIGSTVVCKRKFDENGVLSRYKARLCAKGNTQVKGIDYDETFAPTSCWQSNRAILAKAAELDLEIRQIDFDNAFTQSVLNETIYMAPPPGYNFLQPGKVLKLKKALYGLKQAGRAWNQCLRDELVKIGCKQLKLDGGVFQMQRGEEFMMIPSHVDDLIVAFRGQNLFDELKAKLMTRFKMKDLGELRHFLGVKITRDRNRRIITLSQSQYIESTLKEFNMLDCKGRDYPGQIKLTKTMSPTTDEEKIEMVTTPYSQAVGKLMYLAITTRPDIAYSVNEAARFMSNPGKEHWLEVKRIFRYLKATKDYGLVYQGRGNRTSTEVTAYTDADWAGDVDDSKSISGYVGMVDGNVVAWKAKKQTCVAKSTCQAEYIAMSDGVGEVIGLKNLIAELDLDVSQPKLHVKCDNQAAITITKDPHSTPTLRHIRIAYHFIKDEYAKGNFSLEYCQTKDMIADIMTKKLVGEKFLKCREMLGVKNVLEV